MLLRTVQLRHGHSYVLAPSLSHDLGSLIDASGGCSLLELFFFSSRRRHTRLQGDWSSDVCFFSRRRRHTRLQGDWSSDVCSSDLGMSETEPPSRATAAMFTR